MANEILIALRKYRSNKVRLKYIEQRLHDATVCDSVQSAAKFPYSKHNVSVEGVPPNKEYEKIQIEAQELRQNIQTAEKFVQTLPYEHLRQAAEIYYMEDHVERETWESVADRVGFPGSGESLRVTIYNTAKSSRK